MAQAAPILSTSNVAGWSIKQDSPSGLASFAPVLAGSGASGEYKLLPNNYLFELFLRTLNTDARIGMFIGPNGSLRYGYILDSVFHTDKDTPAPAPAPAPVVDAAPPAVEAAAPAASPAPVVELPPIVPARLEELASSPAASAPLVLPAVDAQVPEPATGALLLTSLAGMALLARRRQR